MAEEIDPNSFESEMSSDPEGDGATRSVFAMPRLRIALLFLFHVGVFTLSYIFAWLLRVEFDLAPEHLDTLRSSLPFVVGVQLLAGTGFGFYRGWWRYVGIADVVRLVLGLSTALLILIAAWYLGPPFGISERIVKAPRGVLVVDWAFALLTLFGARVAIRLGRDRTRASNGGPGKRVLIIGAGDAGETLAREIEHRPQLGMRVVAFVDDYREKIGSVIRGISVRGPISELARIADETRADEALIAIPTASGDRIRQIVHHLAEADLKFKTIPGIDQLVTGRVQISQLRPVNIDDLIRRQRIDLPGDPVRELFQGKRVVVTGAGGTIGSELSEQILKFEPEALHLIERSEYALYEVDQRLQKEKAWMMGAVRRHLVDIRDHDVTRALLEQVKPQIVLHAAAHKHVPIGEENVAEYVRNNTLATRQLAEICEQTNVSRFVFISTDKAINPSSVMGATKRAAEILLLDLAARSGMKVTVVRFGNVIGSSGSVVPLFLRQIAEGGPVTVTHPQVARYFLRTSEAISLVLQAAALGSERHGCVFMLDMGEPIRIADLARDLIQLSGSDDIEIRYTGLRPGEKLYEELRLSGESTEPTLHPQIVVTKAPQPEPFLVERFRSELELSTGQSDSAAVLAALQRGISEYRTGSGDEPITMTGAATRVGSVLTT